MNEEFLPKLYEILATLNYNSERGDLLQEVLRSYLLRQNPSLDVIAEARRITDEERRRDKETRTAVAGSLSPSFWFQQDELLSSNIPQDYIPEYIEAKFGPFAKQFAKIFDFHVAAPLLLGFKLAEYLEFKKHSVGFDDDVYRFTSKEQYADRGFVSIPPESYTRRFGNIVTFSEHELTRILSDVVSPSEVEKILRIISLEIQDSRRSENFRFATHPLLRIDDDTLVVLTPRYITRGLPLIYEQLCKQIKVFYDSKGKAFEKLAQNTLKFLPFQSLTFNKVYGDTFDVDAVVEFEKSNWFVEVSSHPPNLNSLRGDAKAIQADVRKAVQKCIFQGKRCFQHRERESLSPFFKPKKRQCVLIILDGVYPQLNPTTAITFFEESIPIYVINWFDLRHLMDQPELHKFEDFLLWRTIQPMPVIGFDEGDYWGFYFDNYLKDSRWKEGFPKSQKKNLKNLIHKRPI